MAKIKTKIGDIFSVKLNENSKKYFQYVANDLLQLNSDVIRTFKTIYNINENPDLYEIVKKEIDFVAHCVINLGTKMNIWTKAGNVEFNQKLQTIFRSSNDYGSKPGEQVDISYNWRVWQIGDFDFIRCQNLIGENRNAEIGIVMSPFDILTRMQTGKYDFSYPKFE